MRRIVRVFEHDALRVGPGGLSQATFDRLVVYNEQHGNRFFAVGHRRIHFSQFVGVIQVGNLTIEILPKADRTPGAEKDKWHRVLIGMLHRCGLLRLDSLTSAHLRLRKASLFDLYIESFLQETDGLIHQGLVRKYRQTAANLPVLKGRLVFREQLKHNLIHKERSYTVHQTYDRDNVFNAVLKRALEVVSRTACSPCLGHSARLLGLAFEDIQGHQVTADTFRRIAYDRNTERYRRAITLAELIILNHVPDVSGGGRDVLAILFDMNNLFERYVFCELKRAERKLGRNGFRVEAQQAQTFWRADAVRKSIRPDIVVHLGELVQPIKVVLDTKWKLPTAGRPDDADLKQMYAYNLQFGAQESYLLYPRAGEEHDVHGSFTPSRSPVVTGEQQCGMWFVDLFDGDNLDRYFGSRLAERVLATQGTR